jgi:hypothetical protein
MYRRRRAVVLLALVVVALVAAIAVRPALVGSGGGALTATRSSGAGTDAAAQAAAPASQAGVHVYIVQPGDSIWSIVQGSGHRGDLRPLVDRIALQLDGRPLQPGQHLLIP